MINFMLFTALVALNVADALLTQFGGQHELNPIIRHFMVDFPEYWVHIKVGFTTVFSFILMYLGATRLLALGVTVYSFLAMYHAFLLTGGVN